MLRQTIPAHCPACGAAVPGAAAGRCPSCRVRFATDSRWSLQGTRCQAPGCVEDQGRRGGIPMNSRGA